jgi:DNA primase
MQNTLAADIRIIELPPGRDPDDLIRLDPERWSALVREAPGYLDYRFRRGREAHDLEDPRARSLLLGELAPLVRATSDPVVQAEYMQRLAQLCRVDVATLRQSASIAEVPPHLRASPGPAARPDPMEAPPPRRRLTRIDEHAETLTALLLHCPAAAAEVDAATPGFVSDAPRRELLRSLLAGQDAASGEAELEELAAELRARPVAPPLLAEPRVVARQIAGKIRHLHLQEAAREQVRRVAENQREVGAVRLHEAVYDLSQEGADGVSDDESSPAAQVLESQARGRALHAPAAVAAPDPAAQPSAGTNGGTNRGTNGEAPS